MAVICNGTTDFLQRTANLPPYNAFTIAGWFKRSVDHSSYEIPLILYTIDGANNWAVRIQSEPSWDNNWTRLWNSQGGGSADWGTGNFPVIGDWIYLVIQGDGTYNYAYWYTLNTTTRKVSLMGSAAKQCTNSLSFASTHMEVMSDHIDGRYFDGKCCYLRAWDAVLTRAEIEAEMLSQTIVRRNNINTALGACTSSSFANDVSGNGRNWTLGAGLTTSDFDGDVPLLPTLRENRLGTSTVRDLSAFDSSSNQLFAFRFKPSTSYRLGTIAVQMKRNVTSPSGNVTAELWSVSSGVPSAMLVASTRNVSKGDLSTFYSLVAFPGFNYDVTADTEYFVVLRSDAVNGSLEVYVPTTADLDSDPGYNAIQNKAESGGSWANVGTDVIQYKAFVTDGPIGLLGVTKFSTGAGTGTNQEHGTQTISVPVHSKLAILAWSGYTVSELGSEYPKLSGGTTSIGSAPFVFPEPKGDDTLYYFSVQLGYAINPPVGSQTFSWDYKGTAGISTDGGCWALLFYDTPVAGVRDHQYSQKNPLYSGNKAAIPTLSVFTGDLVVAACSSFQDYGINSGNATFVWEGGVTERIDVGTVGFGDTGNLSAADAFPYGNMDISVYPSAATSSSNDGVAIAISFKAQLRYYPINWDGYSRARTAG